MTSHLSRSSRAPRRSRLGAALLIAACSAACRQEHPAPTPAAIPPTAVALCGSEIVSPAQVAALASSTSRSPREAVARLGFDACAAARAAASRGASSSWDERAVLARAVLTDLRRRFQQPPSPEEIVRLRQERWRDFDRPESVRVVHAVAMGDDASRTLPVAEALRVAVRSATDAATFKQLAEQVPHEGVEVRIEQLPAFDRQGRSVEPEEPSLDAGFAAAASALSRPGELSPVVRTPFGHHVILLLERAPAYRPDDATLASLAREEIVTRRTNEALRAMLADLRTRTPTTIERNAGETLSLLDAARRKP